MAAENKRVTMLVRRLVTEEAFVEVDQYPLTGDNGLSERAAKAASAIPESEWVRLRPAKIGAWRTTPRDIGAAKVWPDNQASTS